MTPSVAMCIIPLATGALIAVTLWLTPRLTRPYIYFSVTVEPGFRDNAEGTLILRRYPAGSSSACLRSRYLRLQHAP
jgi:hypothetical protein